jgi:hypothetical protein
MKRILLSVILFTLILSGLNAQRRNGLIGHRAETAGSLILSIGPNYCYADPYNSKGFFGPIANQSILTNNDISLGFRQTFVDNSTFSVFGQNVTNDLGYKAAFSFDNFTGDDKIYPVRNYSFTSTVFQLTGQAEYSIHFGQTRRRNYPHTLYTFLGVGVLNSSAKLNLGTAARGDYQYATIDITPVIPYGIGYYFNFQRYYYIGAELKWEFTFSDKIDGFKPPYPDSKSNDVFQGFLLTFGYNIF